MRRLYMKKIDTDLYIELGRILRCEREKNNLSLDNLSEKLSFEKSKSTLKRYEYGESRIDMEVLNKICNILNLDANDIIAKAKFNVEWNLENEKLNEHFNQSDNFRSLVNSIGWSIQGYSNEEGIDEYKLRKDSIEITVSADEYLELMNASKNFLNKNLQDLVRKKIDPSFKPEPYKEFIVLEPPLLIPYYGHIASAGTGQYVFDDIPPEMIEVEKDMDTMQANFAIGVNGNSMEPTYKDGDTLLVKKQPKIKTGEIGIFMVKGEAFVKELGDGVLISHNKEYGDISIDETTICIGKVVGVR